MKTCVDCIPCFTRQALDAARMASDEAAVHEEVLRRVLSLASRLDFNQPPPVVGQRIHRILRVLTGVEDPYREVKDRFNRFALGLYPAMKQRITCSADAFETALRLAVAGNVIDLGLQSEVSEEEVERAIEEVLSGPLDRAALEDLRQRAAEADDVLYIADNAGEIVFDRLLIEELRPTPVTVAVRGHPVINDATREDAEAAGLTGVAVIVDNGSDAPGTVLADCSAAFVTRFARAGLIIAKGQGNYETLSDVDADVFFLLKAKCGVIADDIGCEPGSIVVTRRRGRTHAAAAADR